MPGLKHATKKRFAHSTTRKKTIKSGISAEYTDNSQKLETVSASIRSLIKEINGARNIWLEVAKHQHHFANALLQSLPVEGSVRTHAKEVETTVRELQRLIMEDEGMGAPHKKITSVLDAYLNLIDSVAKDYQPVEAAYTEVLRYQKKVDKLTKKSKKESVLSRNMEKLTSARATYDTKLMELLARMHLAYDKHEAVFQCAHHAFWIAHDKYAQVVNDTTKAIRWESVAVREYLVNIDVHSTPKLTAIPRVQKLMPPTRTSIVGSRPILPEDDVITPTSIVRLEPVQSQKDITVITPVSSVYAKNSSTTVEATTIEVPASSVRSTQMIPVILAPEPPTAMPHPPVVQTVQIPIQNLPAPPDGYAYSSPPVVHLTQDKPAGRTAVAS